MLFWKQNKLTFGLWNLCLFLVLILCIDVFVSKIFYHSLLFSCQTTDPGHCNDSLWSFCQCQTVGCSSQDCKSNFWRILWAGKNNIYPNLLQLSCLQILQGLNKFQHMVQLCCSYMCICSFLLCCSAGPGILSLNQKSSSSSHKGKNSVCARFQILKVVFMKFQVFCCVILCPPVNS